MYVLNVKTALILDINTLYHFPTLPTFPGPPSSHDALALPSPARRHKKENIGNGGEAEGQRGELAGPFPGGGGRGQPVYRAWWFCLISGHIWSTHWASESERKRIKTERRGGAGVSMGGSSRLDTATEARGDELGAASRTS